MIELPLMLLGGLLGSSHCLGMCGGFALAIGGGARSWRDNLGRQGLYTLGRIFTYAALGAAAAFGGWRLAQAFPWLVNLPAALSILAGALLVWQGLAALGWLPGKRVSGVGGPCLGGTFLGGFLAAPGAVNVFLAGVFTGFLPCGLLYGMLALAASSQRPLAGLVLMAVFGLGTAPAMILAGWGGSLLSLAARQRVFAAAAVCVAITGGVSILRGCGFLSWPGWTEAAGCPLCQ